MKLPRRAFSQMVAGAAALPVVSRIARAQAYPARPARIIVAVPPGGGMDLIARIIGQSLSERLHQPFVIENRPGAGGTIGAEAVVRASPDGYTLLLATTVDAINVTLYEKVNFILDVTPVASIARTPNVVVVHPSFQPETIPELIAYAKANPGKINISGGPAAGTGLIAAELFKLMAGVNMVYVSYRGMASALNDLLGGHLQLVVSTLSAAIEYIRADRPRALAVTSAARSQVLREIPTVADFLPGYESSQWYGVAAPRNTPPAIVEKLNKEINAAITDSKLEGRLADLGSVVFTGSPADFGKLIADETERWGKVIRAANINPE